jgi:hypothetical protein
MLGGRCPPSICRSQLLEGFFMGLMFDEDIGMGDAPKGGA